jgi:UDP-N-acetyl-D-galactosamine dehydrogenase
MSTVAVVGLGYVGLPLAVEFGKRYRTIGFDLSHDKVEAYRKKLDPTGEVKREEFEAAARLEVTTNPRSLREADFIIVAVPTPVDEAHNPDFGPLVGASTSVGQNLSRGATVVFESTVYPGATEEVCIPVLEKHSGLKWKQDFFVGYSPERINPGDKQHTLTKIVKVVSGDSPGTLERVAEIYGSVVTAGVHRASSIKVAEAAKVIENTQRDLNIALVNELALIFNKIGIDTTEVLEAAGTKWNFLPFRPGLVGGHCIGVDPYYLTYKENVIVLGLTFKENVPDTRNSRVVDVIRELQSFGARVYVHDPIACPKEAEHEYGIRLTRWEELPQAAAIVAAVAHDEYRNRPLDTLVSKLAPNGVYVDVKNRADAAALRARGIDVWRL